MMERAVLEYVANSIWQVPLLAATAWLAIRTGKPAPQVQYRMWIGTLALAVILPVIRPAAFHLYVPVTAQPQFTAPAHGISIVPSIEELAAPNEGSRQSGVIAARNGGLDSGSRPANIIDKSPHSIQLSETAWAWVLGIYFAVILLRLLQLARSRRAAGRLLDRARDEALSSQERTILERCCKNVGVRAPRVLFSREAQTPMAIASGRPAVLLPEWFHACTEAEMTAILCHELAHVQRGDYRANWICHLGSLPIAYHPATHGIHREIRRSRELTCDATAAAAMKSPVEYAGCLVGLAQRMEGAEKGFAAAGSAAGLFDHDVFEERIMRLLDAKSGYGRRTMWRATGAVALIAGAATCAMALHITPVVRANAMIVAGNQTAANAQPLPVTVRNQVRVAKVVRVRDKKRIHAHASAPVKISVPIRAMVHVRDLGPIAELAAPLRPIVAMQSAPPVKPATPIPPTAPKLQPAPPPAGEPVTPTPPIAPRTPAQSEPPAIPPPPVSNFKGLGPASNFKGLGPASNFKGVGIVTQLSPEQRAQIDRQLAAARLRIQAQTKMLNSPEFKAQMAQMRRQVEAATKDLRNAEIRAQVKALQSPEFKKQMADMQQQIRDATKQFRSAEVQAQMQYLNSPEFKKNMADMQRQVEAATKQMRSAEFQQQMKALQSPEFRKQMENAQRQIQEATKKLQLNRMQLERNMMQKRGTPAVPSEKNNSVPQ